MTVWEFLSILLISKGVSLFKNQISLRLKVQENFTWTDGNSRRS